MAEIAFANLDALGPSGFECLFEVLGEFAAHTIKTGVTYDERLLLEAIAAETTPFQDALLRLLEVATHEQLHMLDPGFAPHVSIEHFLRACTDAGESRAATILSMHGTLANARDRIKSAWEAL